MLESLIPISKGMIMVGGVCGNNYAGTITNCYNTGSESYRYWRSICY
ncbi:MAG: GLUG motif-containing protein [Coprococcus sp.]